MGKRLIQHNRDRTCRLLHAEIWGEAVHTNRHLRTITVGLGIAVILLIIVVIRIASADPPRPIVVRVDEIGRAEAVAYDVMEAQADPLDPTTKYFLNRFVYDFYSRRRATVEENWSRSLRFLTTDLANASFRAESQNIALLAAGAARDELQVDRVVLRIQANPQEPHSATADFDLRAACRAGRSGPGAVELIASIPVTR